MMPSWESFMKSSSPYGLGITTNMIIHYDADFAFRNGKNGPPTKKVSVRTGPAGAAIM